MDGPPIGAQEKVVIGPDHRNIIHDCYLDGPTVARREARNGDQPLTLLLFLSTGDSSELDLTGLLVAILASCLSVVNFTNFFSSQCFWGGRTIHWCWRIMAFAKLSFFLPRMRPCAGSLGGALSFTIGCLCWRTWPAVMAVRYSSG